jgi:hypothetical protein
MVVFVMNVLFRWPILGLGAYLFSFGSLNAQIPKIFEWSKSNLKKIESSKYVITKGFNGTTGTYSAVDVIEFDSYHQLNYKNYDSDGNLVLDYCESLTSEYLQIFYKKDRFLRLYKSEKKPLVFLKWEPFLFSCYEFLYPVDSGVNHIHLLKVKALLAQLENRSKEKIYLTSNNIFKGKQALSIDIEGGQKEKFNENIFYRIYYVPQSGELLGWQLRFSKNPESILVEYVIEECSISKDTLAIWYPTKINKYFYGWDKNHLFTTPTHYLTFITKTAQFNQWQESDIMIDPSEAKIIRDEEKKVNIVVPN